MRNLTKWPDGINCPSVQDEIAAEWDNGRDTVDIASKFHCREWVIANALPGILDRARGRPVIARPQPTYYNPPEKGANEFHPWLIT